MSRTAYTLFFCVSLVSAAALGQQTQAPMPAPAKAPTVERQKSAAKNAENPAAKTAAKAPMSGQPEESPSPGSALPSQGSAWISPPPPAPTASAALAYPATSSETASRVEDLLRNAAALRGQGNLTKAMELYNEALTLAPQYAETYRQRAMTLLRLGDRVQAQIDYGRFLELDPQARARVRDEIQLFSQSGYARVGETEVALSAPDNPPSAAPPLPQPPSPETSPGAVGPPVAAFAEPPAVYNPAKQSDLNYSIALDDFHRGDYHGAYQWALRANEAMPQARIHALMAQALFAQGFYSGAAGEARAAAAMGPMIDWTTLYGFYDYRMPQYSAQFRALEDYVRKNPSSSDARFLLGYEHQILGQADMAHAQLAISAVLEPVDVTPASMLARDGVEIVGGRQLLTKNMRDREGINVSGTTPAAEAPPQPRTAAAPAKTEVK